MVGKIIDTTFELNGKSLKMVEIQIEPVMTTGGMDMK